MQLGPDGVFRSDLLQQFPWLWHGFGTRLSGDWPGPYTSLKQIHSNVVHRADAPGQLIGEGDALTTATPGVRVGVRTADCVPILLVDPATRAVAAVHAGWRGTVQEIAVRAAERMRQDFGTDPQQLYAAIGPCIAKCCFEVGPEVASQFHPDIGGAQTPSHIDLVEANVQQLARAGLHRNNIDISGLCTVCERDRLHSYRRDKEGSGRMVAAIGIKPE